MQSARACVLSQAAVRGAAAASLAQGLVTVESSHVCQEAGGGAAHIYNASVSVSGQPED